MKDFLGLRWRYMLAAVALGLLVAYVGPHELLATLRRTRPGPLAAYLLGFGLVPVLYGLQVHVALRIGGRRMPLGTTIAAAVNAWSVGTLTPARAGDLTLTYFLGGRVAEADAVAIVVADKLASLCALAALACLSTLFVPVPYGGLLALGAGIVLFVALSALAIARVRGVGTVPGRVASRLFGPRAVGAWEQFRALVRAPRFLAWCLAAATMRWVYICAINLVIFRAVAQRPDFGHVIAATAVGRIISLVPLSVGGVGLKEPAQMVIYAGAGVGAEAVVAVSVLGMACGFLIAAVAPLIVRASLAPERAGRVTG
ncbi:MAG: lysylphosphatidylglycerol synthase transmembrane domain-containing protein [Gemmatimonadaceae bacterium]